MIGVSILPSFPQVCYQGYTLFYGKREVSSDFRFRTLRLQTLDVIFHSFYFGLHTSDLSAIVI